MASIIKKYKARSLLKIKEQRIKIISPGIVINLTGNVRVPLKHIDGKTDNIKNPKEMQNMYQQLP